MSKTHKSTSHSSQSHNPQPSAVAFANVISDIFDACFEQHLKNKKEAWVKAQKDAGNVVLTDDDGNLVSVKIIDTYKI